MTIDSLSLNDYLLAAYCGATGIQLLYYWVVFGRFAFFKQKQNNEEFKPVSVVISAKNEYYNLKNNLPEILNQDYPEFEVVVVNDASDDETIFLLEDLEREYPNLTIITIQQDLNFFRGKKFPLAIGIKSARFEHLLLTDADCKPSSKDWIRHMAGRFSAKQSIVLGYGKQEQAPGFLNQIIRYETAFTALQYFSLAMWGLPYMGVGRNLAYRKSLFIENKGFISHYKVSSGDDDLFINKVANKQNTTIQYHSGSFTLSKAKTRVLDWWIQKRRHLSTGKHYKFKHKFILGTYSMSQMIMLVLLILLLVLKIQINYILLLFAIRLLSQLVILKFANKKLQEKKLLLLSPLIELILAILYPIIVFGNLIHPQKKWK